MPAFTLSFFIFGIFPILCLKMKLVKVEEEQALHNTYEKLQKSKTPSISAVKETEECEEDATADEKGGDKNAVVV